MSHQSYVLITAARNEEAFIKNTIQSVVSQTVPPKKWIIVSDGSSDRTDEIVLDYAHKYEFIHFVRRENNGRNQGFASKVYAVREACLNLRNVEYGFIGNLDADVSFDINYIKDIIAKFYENPRLGISGGFIYERDGEQYRSRPINTVRSVAGAIQMFRRECFEDIGGLIPVKLGGEDWIAEIMARMRGWEVKAFPEHKVYHHKSSTGTRGVLRERMRQGAADYAIGSHPLFELIKCLRRIKEKPYLIGAAIRIISYFMCWFRRGKRVISDEIVAFLQKEQIERLKYYLRLK
jgi:biofilm PGA synthesis N-glycosyltransferase PgaC